MILPTMTRRNTVLVAAVLFIPLLVYAYAGRFSRLVADDYCYAIHARQYGFPGVLVYYYEIWFGRLTQISIAALGAALGVSFAQISPAIVLTLWLVDLLWLCRELALLLNWERPTIYAGATLLLYATLAGTPQIFHSLYWISAVFAYTLPLVLLTFYLALLVRTLRLANTTPLTIFAATALALIAEMACEPFGLAFVGGLFGGIIGVIYFRPRPEVRRALLTLLIPSLIAALLGLGIMVAAPGNTLREGLFQPTHEPLRLITQSLLYTAAFIAASAVYFSPAALGLTLLLPAVIAFRQPVVEAPCHKLRLWIALAALAGIGLITLINIPAIYATSAPPPARVLIIPQFVLVGTLAVIGYLIGLYMHKTHRHPNRALVTGIISVLLVVGPLLSTWNMIAAASRLSDYASEWDAQEAQIVAAAQAGEQEIVVAPLRTDIAQVTGLDTIGANAAAFPNECAATYYGIQSLRTSE